MAEIALRDVAKAYGDTPVITDLSLDIADKEFMVFVGPSGCGKSTALRMIAGLEALSAGELFIDGRQVNRLAPKDRDVAMVFQSYALYPHMSVAENIAFGLKVRKTPPTEIQARVSEAARMLELEELLERKPKALSGGQRQRVALGRAVVRNPSAFLFDEPLSNLDPELRVTMRAEITALQKRLNATMVYVTHDQVEAMTMGDRIAVLAPLSRGFARNLMQVGRPMEVYDKPANTFVARFIGQPSMTLLEAVVTDTGRLAIGDQTLPAPVGFDLGPLSRPGSTILVGVRPEHARPAPLSHWTEVGALNATMRVAEALGHESIFHMRVGDTPFIAKSTGRNAPPRLGETVTLKINLQRLHLFDPDTGERLPDAPLALEATA
ncbi:MAG: ABC transporter ATP-binding protein [Maricaulaceae bacterium]